jgi:hypothetical protein
MPVGNALSQLHDAELSALSIDRHKQIVTLEFRRLGDVVHRLTFHGVVGFRVVDLVQQNVVSRILLSSNGALTDHQLYAWIKWANTLAESESFIQQVEADDLVGKIKAGTLSLLVLDPSWGAELVVIFEKVVETSCSS